MKLIDILPVENIKIPIRGNTKNEIIEELVELIVESDPYIEKKTVLKAIINREETMSTGIGHGIAIPHGKTKAVKQVVASFGVAPEGVDFDALDGQPVYMIFLLAAPEGPAGPHLRCLSMISRLLNQEEFREKLKEAPSPKDAMLIIDEGEQEHLKK